MEKREIQAALVKLGYVVGAIDGLIGPTSTAAIVAFQRAEGLYPDGRAGPKTQAALLVKLETRSRMDEPPAPTRQSMSAIGLTALISREARKLKAYKDTKGIWTIGIGHTAAAGAPIPYAGLTISAAEADVIFARDLVQYEDAVRDAINVVLTDNQFDALVSICFNIGTGGFRGSTFVKRINARASAAQIRAAILMWKKPPEILTRRVAEADQFATPYSAKLPKARSTDAGPVRLA